MTGDFNIQSDTDAKFEMEGYPVSLSLKLNSDAKALTFSNSMYNCLSYATRLSGGPSETPTEITSCTGVSYYIPTNHLINRFIVNFILPPDIHSTPSLLCPLLISLPFLRTLTSV